MASVESERTLPPEPLRDAQIAKAVEDLRGFTTFVTPAFDRLDPRASVLVESADPKRIPHVKIGAKQLRSLWSRITFVVTDRDYPPGYGGAFDSATVTSHIRYDTVNGWNAHPGGLGLIVLHELLHSTKEGVRVWKKQWKNYRADCRKRRRPDDAGIHYWQSPYFSEVEEFCYVGSRALNGMLGLPAYQGPPFEHGYQYGDLGR